MPCLSRTLNIPTVAFNGINHTPLNNTAMIKLGGSIASDGAMDNAGRFFTGSKIEPAEVEFEIPLNAEFDADNYRNQCGDLQVLTDAGDSYLITNAQLSAAIEIKDAEGKVKLMFKGDVAVSI